MNELIWISTLTYKYLPLHMNIHPYIWISTLTFEYPPWHINIYLWIWISTLTYKYLPLHLNIHPFIWTSTLTFEYLPWHMNIYSYIWRCTLTSEDLPHNADSLYYCAHPYVRWGMPTTHSCDDKICTYTYMYVYIDMSNIYWWFIHLKFTTLCRQSPFTYAAMWWLCLVGSIKS